LPNTYFQNSFISEAVFPLLTQRERELDEAEKKIAYFSFSLISLSQLCIVDEAILSNTFSKNNSALSRKSVVKLFS